MKRNAIGAWRIFGGLASLVLGMLIAARAVGESVSPYLLTEQHLACFEVHSLALSAAGVTGLFSTAQGESYLAWRPLTPPVTLRRMELTHFYDGLKVAGGRILAWAFSEGGSGLLSLLDARTGSEIPIWRGAVLALSQPQLAGERIWWITAFDGVPRVAYLDFPWEDEKTRKPSWDQALPESVEGRFVFTPTHAVFSSGAASVIRVWADGQPFWSTVPNPAGHAVVGTSGFLVLALAKDGRTLFTLDPRARMPHWSPWYVASRGSRILAREVQASRPPGAVSFLERAASGEIRFVHLSPEESETAEPSVIRSSLSEVGRPERWAWDGRWLVAVKHHESQYVLVAASVEMPVTEARRANARRATPSAPNHPSPVASASAQRALTWLRSQLGPPFQISGDIARLIDSYEDDVRAGWTYDAALAAIALVAAGEDRLAQELLRGLESLQSDDGSWVFSYDPDRAQPLGTEKYAGAMAWVVMAANFYEWQTGDSGFAEMARRALTYLLRFRQTDPGQEPFGAISMGPARPHVYSVENNLDCYSAFLWRSRLDQEPQYAEIAEGIRDFVLNVQWAEITMGPGHQYFKVGFRDADFYLDAQSWSVLALWDGETQVERLRAALESAERRLKCTTGQLGTIRDIVGFNEKVGSTINHKVWAEGTEGVVAALRVLGEGERAAYYHEQTRRYQSDSGGIPYATENADEWPTVPAVASTAWFLLNELSPSRNPFHPGVSLAHDDPPSSAHRMTSGRDPRGDKLETDESH